MSAEAEARLREILDTRIAVLDGSWGVLDVGEPMVPARAPSFRLAHGMPLLSLPPGQARLRLRTADSRTSAERRGR